MKQNNIFLTLDIRQHGERRQCEAPPNRKKLAKNNGVIPNLPSTVTTAK